MPDPLEALKQHLADRYLGKAGIHGLGISRARSAIRVYVSPEPHPDRSSLLAELRHEAGPHELIVIEEERPFVAQPPANRQA